MAIDDRSRVGFAETFPDERKPSAAAFLEHAARYYRDLGVRVRCIMTDNAPVFRSLPFTTVCKRWRLRHIFTRLYTPRTNGKAERFIQTPCANGLMDVPIAIPANEQRICRNGCIAITGIVRIQRSPDAHPSAD